MRGLAASARTTRTSIGTPPAVARHLCRHAAVARHRIGLAAPAAGQHQRRHGRRRRSPQRLLVDAVALVGHGTGRADHRLDLPVVLEHPGQLAVPVALARW